jgi:hypothetical protein
VEKERAERGSKAIKELVYKTRSINKTVKRIVQMTMFYLLASFMAVNEP